MRNFSSPTTAIDLQEEKFNGVRLFVGGTTGDHQDHGKTADLTGATPPNNNDSIGQGIF